MLEFELDRYQKVFTKILNFLSFKPRTKKEIEDRLKSYIDRERISPAEKGLLLNNILIRLKEDKYVDDKKTLELYVESFLGSPKARSIRSFRMALKKKGFSESDIELATRGISGDLEMAGALKEAKKKLLSLKNVPTYAKKGKISNFLYSKGYAANTIKAVVDTLLRLQ
jgi:SOS response regulatory protein OraA/RecX